ncbi:MAG TPA: YihY family inner membrane protein [Rubrivivax sp.]|nr:YihY family inner membrane protein [Rubrivivax sp.]
MSIPQAVTEARRRGLPGRLGRFVRTLRRWPWIETLRALRLRMREDRLGQSASSLTFGTLFALVPLLTVMLAVFTAFPMFGSFQATLQKFFLQSLVPEGIARPVLRSLTQFAEKARGVGTMGLLMLMFTAISMMLNIDRTLGSIWRVRRPRPLAQRVLVYWAMLTLGPLAVGVSLGVTSLAISASTGLLGAPSGALKLVFDLLQFFLLAAAIAGLFHFVPNTFVRWSHAWIGGLFVAAGFELAKAGLAWYVESMANFSAVYGTFATLPILLMWIYLGWMIVLLGAVLAAEAPRLHGRLQRRADEPGARFTLALELLARLLAERSGAAQGLSMQELAQSLRVDPLQLEPVLQSLIAIGWVGRLEETGDQRHVLLGEPTAMRLEPLVQALLLAPRRGNEALLRRSRLQDMTLAEALTL